MIFSQRLTRGMGIFLALAAGSAPMTALPAPPSSSMENIFLWDEATTRMCGAATDGDFLQAAEAYRKLVHNGVRNGPLLYNLGVALLKARQYGDALAAFQRAERLEGSTPEIRRNMLLALAAGQNAERASLPWHRYLLFWHYGLDAPARLNLAVAGFAGVWLALILRSVGMRHLYRPLVILSLLLLVFYGSSIATTYIQEVEARAQATRPPPSPPSRVTAPEAGQ
jgi:tetratricopeptide (TPR) repeat protein